MIKVYFAFDERWPIAELSKEPIEYHDPETMFIDEELYDEFIAVEKTYYRLQKRIKNLIEEQRA